VTKREPSALGVTGPPCHWEIYVRDMVLQIGGLDARLTTLLCTKISVVKSKEVKTGCNLAESSKESYADDDDNDDLPHYTMSHPRKQYFQSL
jgi:hypothetical protein